MRVALLSTLLSAAVLLSTAAASAENGPSGGPPPAVNRSVTARLLPPPVHPTTTGRGTGFPIRVFLGNSPGSQNSETSRTIRGKYQRITSSPQGIAWVSKKPQADGTYKVRGFVRTGWSAETQKDGKIVQHATGVTTTIGSRTRSFWTTKNASGGDARFHRAKH